MNGRDDCNKFFLKKNGAKSSGWPGGMDGGNK